MIYKAHVVSAWTTDEDGHNVPELAEMLQAGDSLMDVTGNPNVIQEPNANTWELWDRNDGSTIAAVDLDNRFAVTLEWEEDEDAA